MEIKWVTDPRVPSLDLNLDDIERLRILESKLSKEFEKEEE